jgi:hypothetical protein
MIQGSEAVCSTPLLLLRLFPLHEIFFPCEQGLGCFGKSKSHGGEVVFRNTAATEHHSRRSLSECQCILPRTIHYPSALFHGNLSVHTIGLSNFALPERNAIMRDAMLTPRLVPSAAPIPGRAGQACIKLREVITAHPPTLPAHPMMLPAHRLPKVD